MIARLRYLASTLHMMTLREIAGALADLAVGFDQRKDAESAALADVLRSIRQAIERID